MSRTATLLATLVLATFLGLTPAASQPPSSQSTPSEPASPRAGSGTPLIRAFERAEYGGSAQIWDMAQDDQGVLHFADLNHGLLSFDAERWSAVELPPYVNGVDADVRGTLWLGGPDEIGRIRADETGQHVYVSLIDLVPDEHRGFSDIWPVMATDRGVFFCARESLLRLRDGEVGGWHGDADRIFYRAYELDGTLYFAQLGVGLVRLVDDDGEDRLELVPGTYTFADAEINGLFVAGGARSDSEAEANGEPGTASLLVFTRLRGAFRLDPRTGERTQVDGPADSWLREQQVQHAARLADGRLAIATRRGGVGILDEDLRVDHVLDQSAGLTDDKVHSVFVDREGHLWIATDDGINRVLIDSSLTQMGKPEGLEGAVRSVLRHQGRLVVGTAQGVWVEQTGDHEADSRIRFAPIPELATAGWSLLSIDDSLLAGTTDGVFQIRVSQGRGLAIHWVDRLSDEAAIYLFRVDAYPDHAFVSLRNGLGLLRREEGQWRWLGRVEGLSDRIRSAAALPDGTILGWASASSALLRIEFPAAPEDRPTVQRWILEDWTEVFGFGDDVLLSRPEGILRFVPGATTDWPFEPDPRFAELDGPTVGTDVAPLVLATDGPDRLWVVGDGLRIVTREVSLDQAGLDPDVAAGGWTARRISARSLGGPYNLTVDPVDRSVWIGNPDGLYHWVDAPSHRHRSHFATLVRRVGLLAADGTSTTLFGGHAPPGRSADDPGPTLEHRRDRLRFELAAPSYGQDRGLLYQTRLDGFDDRWSEWSREPVKEYTNLPGGDFVFRARGQDEWGDVSHEASFRFHVLEPWYLTTWAYGGYCVAAVLLFFGAAWGRNLRLRRKTSRLEASIAERTRELADEKDEVERVNRRLRDEVDQRKRLEAERVDFEQKLAQTQKLESLGLMAGGIAHDFNNLLMAILGNAELCQEDGGLNDETEEGLRQIASAAERAAGLCNQMLAYAGQAEIRESDVDLGVLAQESLALVRVSTGSRVRFEVELADDLPVCAGDDLQLHQVVTNVLLNAAEALEDGHGTVTLATGVRTVAAGDLRQTVLADPMPAGDYVVLSVTDDGVGMDEDTRRRIFDPFFTTKFAGRGLGLAAALGIVRGHGGALRVESARGEGTRVEILLPALADRRQRAPHTAAPDEPRLELAGPVLVVDDEEGVRRVASGLLSRRGIEVLQAASGTEAIALVEARKTGREGPLAGVLLDLTMPDLDGVETGRRLHRIDPDLRIVLSSGHGAEEIADRLATERFAGFLHKPYRPHDLVDCLRDAFGRGQDVDQDLDQDLTASTGAPSGDRRSSAVR